MGTYTPTCFYINLDLSIDKRPTGINIFEPRNQSEPLKWSSDVRVIEISKSLDFKTLDDRTFNILYNNLSKLIDLTDTKYRFILNFQREESLTDIARIEFFKRILEGHKVLVLSINIGIIEKNEIILLNNNDWIHQHHKQNDFSRFLREVKENDLGTMKKKFMFLNNHYSKPRFDILKFLYKNGFNKDGNISFNYFDIDKTDLNQKQFDKMLNEYGIPYPLEYDTYATLTQITNDEQTHKKLMGINHIGTVNINYRLYIETFFEIITETEHLLLLDGVHMSEKIYKPLKAGNPFAYWGKPEMKNILMELGLTFNSPLYFFGNGEAFFTHLENVLSKDQAWYNDIQREYLDEYLTNIDKWNKFLTQNNDSILKFAFI
jgi:hypothetical protein